VPKENEGEQDKGGKHGGQKDKPKPEPKPGHYPLQKIKVMTTEKPTSRNNKEAAQFYPGICRERVRVRFVAPGKPMERNIG
jgi:hypothetical protein